MRDPQRKFTSRAAVFECSARHLVPEWILRWTKRIDEPVPSSAIPGGPQCLITRISRFC
jgi:hypothetical protein